MKLLLIATCGLLLSCSKKDHTNPPRVYTGDWDVEANTGSLYFFDINLKLHNNGTGDVTSFMKDANFEYPASAATWARITGDSLRVNFDIPAYPGESWEFRGLGDATNQSVTGEYFMISKSNGERLALGLCELKAD